jgi:CPA1 family monovalent cation:H+ antiporter
MAVWEHLNVDQAHIAYAVLGTFSAIFSLVSLFVKEKLYIGEATVAAIAGLIVGPYCLNWFTPTTWGNTDSITLEISRVVLCLQIFAVAVELPKKYMLKHWLSVFMLLVPVMTYGWLVIGAFIYLLIPGLNFSSSLVVSACITATDPVLAAAVVGKGKFAKRVPGHLRNLLSAESGCNDGMAFPFIFLGINLVLHHGNAGEIVKDWICVTILYECFVGCILGAVIGYVSRHTIKFCERKKLIDRESFLAFYIFIAVMCAGFGSILGVDDLLVSFAAGAAFAWDGWFAKKTEESHVSTVIDLVLNLAYFVYFGAIVPWPQFNDSAIGTDVWRLIILAIIVLTLRRIPAVMAFKIFIPDIKTWREALFCGHFGPIGVGAVYAAIVARAALEGESTPSATLPAEGSPNYQLIVCIWPIVTFLIISSIVVHGSSVAVITLGRHLNTMNISMSFTTTNGNNASWISRLPELKANGRSFSLHRIDTMAPTLASGNDQLSQAPTIETSGVPVRPAGGMHKKNAKTNKKRKHPLKRVLSHDASEEIDREKLQREKEAKATVFALGSAQKATDFAPDNYEGYASPRVGITPSTTFTEPVPFPGPVPLPTLEGSDNEESNEKDESTQTKTYNQERRPTNAYKEGHTLIVEDQHGEVMDTAQIVDYDEQTDSLKLKKVVSSSSSIGSILSPIRSLEKSLDRVPSEKRKLVAYKTGDHLIIENADGEIVRRYKVNHHKKDGSRKRTGSILSGVAGKALSVVGLKTTLTGESKESGKSPVSPVTPHNIIEESDEEDDEGDERDESSVEELEDPEETAFERQRRLAALGQILNTDESEDEEDEPVVHNISTISRVTSTIANGLRVNNKSEAPASSSIKFQDPPTH